MHLNEKIRRTSATNVKSCSWALLTHHFSSQNVWDFRIHIHKGCFFIYCHSLSQKSALQHHLNTANLPFLCCILSLFYILKDFTERFVHTSFRAWLKQHFIHKIMTKNNVLWLLAISCLKTFDSVSAKWNKNFAHGFMRCSDICLKNACI